MVKCSIGSVSQQFDIIILILDIMVPSMPCQEECQCLQADLRGLIRGKC